MRDPFPMCPTFHVDIHTENDAFAGDNAPHEIARILKAIAARVLNGHKQGSVKDINGNTVAHYFLK